LYIQLDKKTTSKMNLFKSSAVLALKPKCKQMEMHKINTKCNNVTVSLSLLHYWSHQA